MNTPGFPTPQTRRWLLALARHHLAQSIVGQGGRLDPPPDDPSLNAPARVFVSWHAGDELVGRIGTLSPWPTLRSAVARYAVAAGSDPRTPELRPEQLPGLDCDISILGEPRPLDVRGFNQIEGAIRPGLDGVVLHDDRGRSAFFLPVVWKTLSSPREFLLALARKAGIDLSRDQDRLRADVLEVVAFGDVDR